MNDQSVDTVGPTYLAPASAVLVAGALGLAVFYQGPQIPLLAGAQFLLVAWIALSFVHSYSSGMKIPITALSVSLTLFWLWLAVSLLWSAAPVTSTFNFWWVGSLALVFWAYTISPQRERIWFYVSRFAVAGALGLCAMALVQLFAWHQPPRSTFVNIHSFAALMMLVALPLGGCFVFEWYERAAKAKLYALGAVLFVLYFTIATTEGRGTALSILLGFVVFAAVAARSVGVRPVLILGGLMVASYLGANIVLHGGLLDRLATLSDPASAAFPRLLIWRGSWAMLMQHPWWGIGLGTYYLAWPPFRDPTDSTLGFFVHNDYLQIWIEAGLPALCLLVGTFVSVLFVLIRMLRRPGIEVARRIEALGLFVGLLAIAAHSFLDFNLYILPISIVAGLALGRFHEHATAVLPTRIVVVAPARAMRLRYYRLTVILLAMSPMFYFVALGLSDYLYKRAFSLASVGRLEEADAAFTWAERLLPRDDKVLTMHADLYRHVIKTLPRTNAAERRSLYEAALALLEDAETANRYRALVHVVRARVLEENPDLTGPRWRAQAEYEYTKALALNPRFFMARVERSGLLVADGRMPEAFRILDAGIDYWYYPAESVAAYYTRTAELAQRLGNVSRAAAIREKIVTLRRAIAATVPARPVALDPAPPKIGSSQ